MTVAAAFESTAEDSEYQQLAKTEATSLFR
jgi:hypothetical protein